MTLTLTPFTANHIESALALLQANYAEERSHVPALAPVDELTLPSLEHFARNGLGIAALQNGTLHGYIAYHNPFQGLFGPVMGTFSPLHAHAAQPQRRAYIYNRLYQAAGEILVSLGVVSHAIIIFAHDTAAIESFFTNGFGMRTVDAVRSTAPIASDLASDTLQGITYGELPLSQLDAILPLHHGLTRHLGSSPMFMTYADFDMEALRAVQAHRQSRYFVAQTSAALVGYIEVTTEGENFTTVHPAMANICGAYLQPEWRGRGIYTALLAYTIDTLRAEGNTRLGVDYEGFNPTASAFWQKHFIPYTRGLTRRIDERILDK